MTMLDYALKYLKEYHWNIIPIWGVDRNGRCRCGDVHEGKENSIGKHPILPNWKGYQTREVTEEEVRGWWEAWPDANIAALTGTISHLFLVDDDDRAARPGRYKTLCARSGGGGYHYFFRVGEEHLPNSTRKLDRHTDTRGEGGYVLLPPSRHRNGIYSWENLTIPSGVPPEILSFFNGTNPEARRYDRGQAHGQGSRNDAMTRECGRMFAKGLFPREVLSRIRAWNDQWCFPPLPDSELIATVTSLWNNRVKPQREEANEERPYGSLRILTGREMFEKYAGQSSSWVIPHWLPEKTCCIMGAPPGTYKTWFLLDLAISIVSGKPFLNHYPVSLTGRVLIVQQEDNFTMLLDRMARMMGIGEIREDRNGVIRVGEWKHELPYFSEDRTLHVENTIGMGDLEKFVQKERPQLVAIDPMFSFVPLADDFGVRAAQLINGKIKRLRDDYGVSFLLVHHTRKGSEEGRKRDSLWGSQLLNATLETAWHLREDKGALAVDRHSKTYGEEPSLRMKWSIGDQGCHVRVLGL